MSGPFEKGPDTPKTFYFYFINKKFFGVQGRFYKKAPGLFIDICFPFF